MLHPLHPTPLTAFSAAAGGKASRASLSPQDRNLWASESRDEPHGCRYVKLQVWTKRAVLLPVQLTVADGGRS